MWHAHISATFSRRVVASDAASSANRTVNQSRPWELATCGPARAAAPPAHDPWTWWALVITVNFTSQLYSPESTLLFIEHHIPLSDAWAGVKRCERCSACASLHSTRRREIRNNGGLKYNECDLKYITSATFPSRPRPNLFRLFVLVAAAAGVGDRTGEITSGQLLLIKDVVCSGVSANTMLWAAGFCHVSYLRQTATSHRWSPTSLLFLRLLAFAAVRRVVYVHS